MSGERSHWPSSAAGTAGARRRPVAVAAAEGKAAGESLQPGLPEPLGTGQQCHPAAAAAVAVERREKLLC